MSRSWTPGPSDSHCYFPPTGYDYRLTIWDSLVKRTSETSNYHLDRKVEPSHSGRFAGSSPSTGFGNRRTNRVHGRGRPDVWGVRRMVNPVFSFG
jgi:hypothetical protein